MRNRKSQFNIKKHVRETYTQRVFYQAATLPKPKVQKVNCISFGEDALIIGTKDMLLVYSLLTMKPFYQSNGCFWQAVFIPGTSLIAAVLLDGTKKSRRTLRIIDIEKDEIVATVLIKFEIEEIKAAQYCICLVGEYQVSVIHYPTLKPICHQLAGSGFSVIYDISFEGLTLAYNNQKRGTVIVHNFSGVSVTRARLKSMQNLHMKMRGNSFLMDPQQQIRNVVEIKAHNEAINLIRLSPNGTRIATSSHKGTMIRIFLTQNGKIWEQLRVGYELSKILDISFYEQGNVLSCITDKNLVLLFNTKLETEEQYSQNLKRGYKIYQQKNPKSIFSFLSFFYDNLGNEHPFAHFPLIKPQQKQKQKQKTKPEQEPRQKQQKQFTPIIQQEEDFQNSEMKPLDQNFKQSKQEITLTRNRSIQIQQRIQHSSSMMSIGQVKSKRSSTIIKKFNAIDGKKENYEFIAPIFNTLSKIFIGGNNFVWVLKGLYLFELKYDPFNGGEMYHKETLKFD